MLQILEANPKKSFGESIIGGLAEGGTQLLQDYAARKAQEKQLQMAEALKGKQLQQEYQLKEMGKQKEFAHDIELEKLKHEHNAKIEELKAGYKPEDKTIIENRQNVSQLNGALDTLKDMKRLRKKGNLGVISAGTALFSGETRKDRGEYERLGKSLISYSSNIPIRNRQEFEALAHDLYDPNITDDAAEGILNAMEKIISRSMEQYQDFGNNQVPSHLAKPQRPPLTAFMKG